MDFISRNFTAIPDRCKRFLFSPKLSDLLCAPPSLLFGGCRGVLYSVLMAVASEADHFLNPVIYLVQECEDLYLHSPIRVYVVLYFYLRVL